MQLLNRIISNNDHSIEATQENINNSTFSNTSIEILNDDCIENILSHLDNKQDLINCKLLNKRFCYIIENTGFLYYQLYFEKNCLSPQAFLALPKNYIISIDRRLENKSEEIAKKHLSIAENSKHSKRKLFYSIEKNLSNSKKIEFQTTQTIIHSKTITTSCLSKDNNIFVIGSFDGIIKVFSFINGNYQLLSELKHVNPNDPESGIDEILLSPDNAYIITSSFFFYIIWYKSIKGYIQIQTITHTNDCKIYFKNDNKRLFIECKYSLENSDIVVFDLIAEKCKRILAIDNDELGDIFNVCNGTFKNHVDLKPSIKNDNWLCFMLQRYAISSICNAEHDYGDIAFATYIKDIVHENTWKNKGLMATDIYSIVYSTDMKLMHVSHHYLSSSILEYTNNKWQLKLKFNSTQKISRFSHDNQRIITTRCYSNGISQVIIWNIAGKKAYKELVLNDIEKATFSSNSKYIMAHHYNEKVIIWQLVDNAWRVKLSIQSTDFINDIYFSNYNWMIVNLFGKVATILKANNYDENTNVVTSLTNNKKTTCNQDIKTLVADNIFFATDSNYFATTHNSIVKFWNYNANKYKPIAIFKHPEKITNILFSLDKSHIIISADFHITICSLVENKYDKQITIKTKEKNRVYFKENGKKIIIAELSGSIKVLKLVANNWQHYLDIKKTSDAIKIKYGVFINKALIMQFNDNWLSSMLQTHAIIEILHDEKSNCNARSFTTDINYVIAPGSDEFTRRVQSIIYTKDHDSPISEYWPKPNIISFSKDNLLMYLGFDNKNCVILEHNNNQWSKKLIFNGGAGKAYFSQDNQRIITISNVDEDNINRLIIWNITADTAYQELGLNNISSANFSPDGTQILTTSTEDNQVKIWSLLDDRWQFQQAIPNNDTPCFANFTDDAKIIYIVFNNKKVKIINISYTE